MQVGYAEKVKGFLWSPAQIFHLKNQSALFTGIIFGTACQD
jgi:hypothetical protein